MRKFYRKNTKLRKEIRAKPCIVCVPGRQRMETDPCHIRTFGSSGVDADWNIVPMCRDHHNEQHKLGWYQFTKKYLSAGKSLVDLGWVFLECNGQIKMFNEKHENIRGNR